MNSGAASPTISLQRMRLAVAAYYFVPGMVFASWASRIPDVRSSLQLSDGQLGSMLFAIPIGQLLMMSFSGILVTKLGSKKMVVLAEVGYALMLLGLGFSQNKMSLVAFLVGFGMMANLMNIATNTRGLPSGEDVRSQHNVVLPWTVEPRRIHGRHRGGVVCQHLVVDRRAFLVGFHALYAHHCSRTAVSCQ